MPKMRYTYAMSQKSTKLGLGLIVGAVGGAIAGLFLAPKAGKELRKDAQKLYDEISKNPEAAVKEIFGKVTEESMQLYSKVQKEVSAGLGMLSENYKTLNTEKYKEVVKQAVDNVKEVKKLPEDQLKKLMTYLEQDIKKLTAPRKSVKKPSVKKAPAKKVVKKSNPVKPAQKS